MLLYPIQYLGNNRTKCLKSAGVSTGKWTTSAGAATCMLLALTAMGSAIAQTTGDNFDVTVEPSESQEQVTTQGQASLDGATLSISSLQNITTILRLSGGGSSSSSKEEEEKDKSKKTALLASLGSIIYAVLDDDDSEELGADFSRWGSFTDISYGFGSHDTTSNTPSHDIDSINVTAGVDYRYSPTLVLGGAFVYSHSNNEFSGNIGDLEVDGYSLAVLGSWYPQETWYVDGIIRGGFNDYDTTRRDTTGTRANGSTDGGEFSISAGTGYDFTLRGWTAGPLFRITYTDVTIDSYRERNSTQALDYDDQDIESLTTNLGAQVSRAINTNFGVVLPQANVEWVHEFEDDGRRVIARPVAGGPAFAVPVDDLDSNFFRGSIGTTLLLTHGRMLFARYEGELGRADRNDHSISLGARLEF